MDNKKYVRKYSYYIPGEIKRSCPYSSRWRRRDEKYLGAEEQINLSTKPRKQNRNSLDDASSNKHV
jgi:hypothetical protein